MALGTSTPTELFPEHRRQNVNPLGLLGSAAAMLLDSATIFSSFTPGARMQLVAGNGGAFGNVAKRDINVELAKCLLHEPRVRHQFLLRLRGLYRQVRMLEKIERRQLVIPDEWRGSNRDRLRTSWARASVWARGAGTEPSAM